MLDVAPAFEEDVTCRTRFVLSKYDDNWFGEASAVACGFESFPTRSRLQHARCPDIQCCYNELFFWGALADSTCLLGEAVEVLRLKFVVASLFFNMLIADQCQYTVSPDAVPQFHFFLVTVLLNTRLMLQRYSTKRRLRAFAGDTIWM